MYEKKIVKKSILLMLSTLFVGCVGNNASVKNYPEVNSLAQERLFLRDKPFVLNYVQPTIPFPIDPKKKKTRSPGTSAIKMLIDVVAPDFIGGAIDFVGKSMVAISGKDDTTTTIDAQFSNFFYKDATYNLTSSTNPAFNLLFISGEFGESAKKWYPNELDSTQRGVFETLHLVGEPNFYMEAKIFPVPETQYMEVVPTYIFYNRTLNPKGMDSKRDLQIRFSFYGLEGQAKKNLFSEGRVVLRDVQVGKEYGEKELANVRTTFIKMPKIAESKKGYSGGYTVKVSVTETRDINEWLASLGESISDSKEEIISKYYLTDEAKIERDLALAKAKINVRIVQEEYDEAVRLGKSKVEQLRLESKLLEEKAAANREAIKYGKEKLY